MKNNQNASLDLEAATEQFSKFNLTKPKNPSHSAEQPTGHESKSKKKLINLFQWLTKSNTQQKALLLLCVAAAIIDPLFFYIPMINKDDKCIQSDQRLGVSAISSRTLIDVLHFVVLFFYYEMKWNAQRPRLGATAAASSASGEENKQVSSASSTVEQKKGEIPPGSPRCLYPRNSKAAGQIIQILCIIPLPQAATMAILILKGSPRMKQMVTLLKFSVLSQFILRAFRVFPLFHEATANSFTLLKSHFWIGAGFNLLLFVISSHVLGAFWYLLSVGRTMDCWKVACNRVGCNFDSLYCGGPTDNKSYLDGYWPMQPTTNSSAFNFGIYLSALESNMVASKQFPLKLSYCFWWGLRNLSSLGQNLITSAYEWEICFSICISILGLILFSLFIGNMQAYFQDRTKEDLKNMKGKMGKVMKKQRTLMKWQPFELLSQNLREDIISCVEDNWLETTEVDLKTTLNYLPKDLGQKVKREIFSELWRKVTLFRALNLRGPDSTINRMKPEVFANNSLVFRKGHPIDKMVFILNGKLTRQTGTDGTTAQELQPWDLFGEELLKDIITSSSTSRTLSTADIKTCTKVEAFFLDVNDLQFLANLPKDAIEDIRKRIEEAKMQRAAAARQKQKKKAAEKTTGLTRSASFDESRTVGGTHTLGK